MISIPLTLDIRPLMGLLNSDVVGIGNPSPPGVYLICNRPIFVSLFASLTVFIFNFLNLMVYGLLNLI